MKRQSKNKRANHKLKKLSRLFAVSNRGWVLDPILSESEEWTECVRGKSRKDEEDTTKDIDSSESSDDFDE